MYSMYYVCSMRNPILYLSILLTLAVQCQSSVPKEAENVSKDFPRVKQPDVCNEPFEFIGLNAAYAIVIDGNDATEQFDITPEKLLQIIYREFDVSYKPFVRRIILKNLTSILREDFTIYLFQDSLMKTKDIETSLRPYIMIESPELCKSLRLSSFNKNTKTRKKGSLRCLENESIPLHIVWSKSHVLMAQKKTHTIDEIYKKFEKQDNATFTSHPLYDSLPAESISGYLNIEAFRDLGVLDLKNLPSILPREVQFYLENLVEQSLSVSHGIVSGQNVENTTTLHADFFTKDFQPCLASTTFPTTSELRLVADSNANGYGSLILEREVIDAMLHEIELTELIERLIGESKLDELKKLDPFGILQKVEDAITERIDLEVINRFKPSGQISFGIYGDANGPLRIAALIHGSTRELAKLQPWVEKIPSSWIPDDRGIYISNQGLVIGYGLSSKDLRQIATSNEIEVSSTVLSYNTSLTASHKLIEQHQDQIRVFNGIKESPLLADLLRKYIGDNYSISIGLNPVSALEIVFTNHSLR